MGIVNFIQRNSPDGGFLQSPEWMKFQEAVGRKIHNIFSDGFWANIIEHTLPIAGKYFYVPRGPILEISNDKLKISKQIQKLANLAKKNNSGWVRIEPTNEEILEIIKKSVGTNFKFVRSPHDMQPKELFIIDITKSEEQLLSEMKPKTRYNIKLAQKHGVSVLAISKSEILNPKQIQNSNNQKNQSLKYISEFLRLVKVTAERDGITPHPENYYRKMIEMIPDDILKVYVAEYNSKIIAVNLVIFYGDTCTYLHGASDNENRNVMAPYLLQWRQILDAKEAGCKKYDFGGIHTKTGGGITRFKLGFSPNTEPTKFPGCFDVIIKPRKYWLYRGIQKVKSLIK